MANHFSALPVINGKAFFGNVKDNAAAGTFIVHFILSVRFGRKIFGKGIYFSAAARRFCKFFANIRRFVKKAFNIAYLFRVRGENGCRVYIDDFYRRHNLFAEFQQLPYNDLACV